MAQIIPLTTEEAANSGFTHKVVVTYTDVVALTSGTAYSIYPAFNSTATKTNLLVKDVGTYIKTAFVGTGTLVAVIGDGSTANAFQASTTWKTAGWIVGAQTADLTLPNNLIKFTPTAGTDITTFTAGEAHIFLSLVDGALLTK